MPDLLRRPELGLVLLVLALPAFWLGGEVALVMLAVGGPGAVLLGRWFLTPTSGMAVADQVIASLDTALRDGKRNGRQTGCLVLQFDNLPDVCDRLGRSRQSEILAACVTRIRGALRQGDTLFALEDGGLVVVLGAGPRLDLEGIVRIAGRLQLVGQQPMLLERESVQLTCCIGFCHSRQVDGSDGRGLLDAAQVAVEEAALHRPGAIRAYSADLARVRADRNTLRSAFSGAVESDQIQAHFQPQLSTDSGAVSGMEALVRWHHPERGLLMPGAFLPALEGTELMDLLGETMLAKSLAALCAWDRAGVTVPSVSVNLSSRELSDPQLPERLGWQLDRFGLAPRRLTIEILESVVAREGDDIIARNIDRIAQMGCGLDLDDFGTGNASITSIRRFRLRRLKIDRSFVRTLDTDREQQDLVTAILSLAERLGLETLAEGVETQGEHTMLAQLGCGHVQGYVVARPMPAEDILGWMADHQGRLEAALRIGERTR
ncbi:MAG: GGDEF domain-containing phosphodiesterase [Rhodobacterales bacterium]|nr:GGDEF domain-containing phosphodiesterase [Rhodobacterales bacterium]